MSGVDSKEADYILSMQFKIPVTEIPFTDLELTKKQHRQLIKNVNLRCKHTPITKIFKTAYFYGNKFYINDNVLSPRFDTEVLVEKALEHICDNARVLDLCTGSGCIAISLAKSKKIYVEGCDMSKKALHVANKNNKLLGGNVEFYQSNMFDKVQGKFNVIVSNPPYIETDVIAELEPEVRIHDPRMALDGGVDGLKFYRQIASCVKDYLLDGGSLLMEIGFNQAESVIEIFKPIANNIEIVKDYNNNDRVIIVKI